MRERWSRLQRHGLIVWRLSWAERGTLVEAWLLLQGVALALRFLSFQRIYGFLERTSPPASLATGDERLPTDQVRGLVYLVNGAATHNLFPITCLQRSMVLWWLLRRRGIASELRIGVRKEQGQFAAHAWVEHQNLALNDRADIGREFAPFDKTVWSVR